MRDAWNSLAMCAGVIPIPVSLTRKVIHSPPASAWRVTANVTIPCPVNWQALLNYCSCDHDEHHTAVFALLQFDDTRGWDTTLAV